MLVQQHHLQVRTLLMTLHVLCLVPHFSTSFPLHTSIAWDMDQDNVNTRKSLAVSTALVDLHMTSHISSQVCTEGFLDLTPGQDQPLLRDVTPWSAKPVQIMGAPSPWSYSAQGSVAEQLKTIVHCMMSWMSNFFSVCDVT